jgi:CRISPR-associated protein (TIGR03984 family)
MAKMGELKQSIEKFTESFGEAFPKETYAILYAPEKCFLGLVDRNGNVEVKDNLDKFNLDKVYEARVFNDKAELRWLKNADEIIISDISLRNETGFVDIIKQKYLLWGEISPNNDTKNNGEWTELAEARIGKFYVPIKTTSRACFEATEYLKSYDEQDGNVAVFEERLTGISEVKK